MYIGISYTKTFNTTPLILLVKAISSLLNVTNSGGLMVVCRWTSVNDPVKKTSVL